MVVLLAFHAAGVAGLRARAVFDFLAALTEVALASFVAILIDLMKATATPATFLSDHAGLLLWMAFVVLIARPAIVFGYDITKNQVLSPPFQTRVRWQTHGYLLRQSLSFFQNDFAGRVANKLMQTASAMRDSIMMLSDAVVFVAVQWLSALVLFWAADARLVIPLLLWLAAYGATLMVLRATHPRALDGGLRGAFDAARAHRRQLHEHPDRQALRPRRARGRAMRAISASKTRSASISPMYGSPR